MDLAGREAKGILTAAVPLNSCTAVFADQIRADEFGEGGTTR